MVELGGGLCAWEGVGSVNSMEFRKGATTAEDEEIPVLLGGRRVRGGPPVGSGVRIGTEEFEEADHVWGGSTAD